MSSNTLYEIANTYLEALDLVTDPDADIDEHTAVDTIDGLEGELDDKIINVAKYIRNLEATAENIKFAENSMRARRHRMESMAKWLKGYILDAMSSTGKKKVSSEWFDVSRRKNPPAVSILDEDAVPDEHKSMVCVVSPDLFDELTVDYRMEYKETKVDKAGIKKLISSGVDVDGAELTQSESVRIT
jgi:hypothetical protein